MISSPSLSVYSCLFPISRSSNKELCPSMETCVCMAESLRCSPETLPALLIGYAPIQNKKLKKKKNYAPSAFFRGALLCFLKTVFNHPCIYRTRYQREEVKEIKSKESAFLYQLITSKIACLRGGEWLQAFLKEDRLQSHLKAAMALYNP